MLDEETFEDEFVHKFYCQKSGKFSGSRTKPWPFTIKFMEMYANPHSLILDSGCGNGRQFIHQNTIGIDFSENLLADASKKSNIGLIKGNIHTLPFRDATFDIVMSVAVIHHLSTHERRLNALLEMKRIMKDGAICLIYAWHIDASSKAKFSQIKGNEYFVSWKGEEDLLRYYCLFDEQMLSSICLEAGFEVLDIQREQESVYAIAKRPKTVEVGKSHNNKDILL